MEYSFIPSGGIKSGIVFSKVSLSGATEFGLEFQTSKAGTIFGIGANLPRNAAYIVSLWDADTKTLLTQDTLWYIAALTFDYDNNGFSKNHKNIDIVPGKKYMAGILLPPTNPDPPGSEYPAFKLSRADAGKIWPLTQGSITITGNYSKQTTIPAFPDVLNPQTDVLLGVLDIGFSPAQ